MKVVCIDLYKEGDNPNFLHYYNNKYLTIGKVYDVIYANEFFCSEQLEVNHTFQSQNTNVILCTYKGPSINYGTNLEHFDPLFPESSLNALA